MRRVHCLRENQEQTIDDEEKEIETQKCPEKQKVGEHAGAKSSAQGFHGWMPQLEGSEDGEATEHAVTPSLRGE